jgi:hypothetical protein
MHTHIRHCFVMSFVGDSSMFLRTTGRRVTSTVLKVPLL